MLLSRREGWIRRARVVNAAVVRWRPAGARGSRGVLGAGQRGRRQSRARGEDDAWVGKEQEVDGGGLHSGGQGRHTAPATGEAEEKQSRRVGARGGRREGRGSEDWFAKQKNYRDPTEKKDFPLI
jgi:hypothetical protein